MASAREIYRLTRKRPDLFWNTYVCRPVAAVFVAAVQSTAVTPNQVTILAFFVALTSAALLVGLPGYAGLVAAIVVYQASYVLDCADGMLARHRGLQSQVGHLLDFLMDEIKAFIILGAVAIRLYLESKEAWLLLLGIVGLVCLASGIALTTFLRRPEVAGPDRSDRPAPSAPTPLRRAIGVVERVAKLLIHYPSYILLVALAGHIEWYFYPYIAVNAIYAAKTFLQVMLRFGRTT